ncbi:hypothetical protein SEA_NICEHOUSE_212 [Rhodococcus phage NiceHouse]|nr:hypothetical protein SEA_NICEHOUSE_212 [Rhodococcus phage NiceHouse]
MSLADFIEQNRELITHDDTVPVVSYRRDAHYEKTLFGIKNAPDFTGEERELYGIKNVKAQLKQSRLKLKNGQHFVARSVGYQSFELVPGLGIVLGNLSAKTGDADELQYILDQPNVRALVWHNEQLGTVYYEAEDQQDSDVQGVQ